MTISTEWSLAMIERCFGGAVPAALATSDQNGLANVTYLSRAHQVDEHRIALSNQFMSKTSRNLAHNPRASLLLIDPVTYDEYRLSLVFERTERRGPVFERLRVDIDALAALTGMQDVFRLRAADIFRVVEIVPVPPNPRAHHTLAVARDLRRDLASLAKLMRSLSRATDLDVAIDVAMDGLERHFGYRHTYLLLVDEVGERLFTVASRGYDEDTVGAEVAVGDGQIGAVAERCEPISVGGLRQLAKYSRSIRRQYEAVGVQAGCEQPLPDLAAVDSRIAVPAMSAGQLIGVLVVESRDQSWFDAADEQILSVVAAALANAVELDRDEPNVPAPAPTPPRRSEPHAGSTSLVRFFEVDGSTFVDGEYLIKGVAGRILWSLLDQFVTTGRTEFTNKELRLDPTLDLPGFKDNLESRLLLLRRRLDERHAPVRILRTGRGRFRVDAATTLILERGDGREA